MFSAIYYENDVKIRSGLFSFCKSVWYMPLLVANVLLMLPYLTSSYWIMVEADHFSAISFKCASILLVKDSSDSSYQFCEGLFSIRSCICCHIVSSAVIRMTV